MEPLDAARGRLHHDEDLRFKRAGLHATAIILGNCRALGRSWWGWTVWDWARPAGSSRQAFRSAQVPTETTVRPFLLGLAFVLGGFTDYQHVGNFNRLHLAKLIFGDEPVTTVMRAVADLMQGWGYRSQTDADGRHRLRGV
ncbi:hypothetical protein [Micromonospora sp. RTP1Z1]|uniref:hypothetical protein n=1 Tax=Micromonospora sp. RTP1Z1 TaxID=2994043 RepID=UPI0029C80328|nr:hypothetical protein [Micromonospora sp. RTP1Z1]